jgi:hypothetical protein
MHCQWDAPDRSRNVVIDCGLVEELRRRAIDGFLALPNRGREIGGLLLGRILPGAPAVISIEAAEEIPCEHRFGPSYVLSGPDRTLLRTEMDRPRAGDSPAVIGFYRSYCRRELALDAPDRDLIQKFFPNGDAVFLLLEPLPSEDCRAAFTFPRDGHVPAEPPYLPFRFDPATMGAPAPEPRVLPKPPSFVPPSLLEPARRRRSFWLPLIACFIVSIGAAFVYELTQMRATPASRPAELNLDAAKAVDSIELRWDPVPASRGELAVTDGPDRKQIDLTTAEVQSGRYFYHPEHPSVLFRLAVVGPHAELTNDSLRYVSVAAPAAPPPPPQTETHAAAGTPVPVHEVQPRIPEGIRSRLDSRVTVPVAVHVSNSGRVTSATASERGQGALYRYLAEQSVKAAREWRFTPARGRNGKPVASVKTIQFSFVP